MAVNLLEMMQGSLGQTLAREASRYLGESETATKAAVGAALPALLAGVVQQGATPGGLADLFRTLTGPQVDPGLMTRLGGMLATGDKSVVNLGGTLLGALFGDRTGALTGAISSMSGMKSSSISTLLALAAPAVFSYLKGYLTQNNLGIGDLANLLAGQTDHLRASLDDRVARGLGFAGTGALLSSLTSAFAGRATGAAEKTAAAAWDAGRGVARAGEGAFATAGEAVRHVPAAVPVFQRPWFWALIGALILLGWALLQNWSPGPGVATKSLDLPDGRRIEVAAGGFLDSLAAFLAGTGMAAPKAFTFDDLHFETGSATLTEASSRQLGSLAAMLTAYPNVTTSVRGHTDDTGDPAANKKLSADRAAAVQQALVARGVPASRITSEGFGAEQPIASNDSEEGRARNRRVELMVVKG
jgi:outer membrane protein OmpA-like peptidoglycan-associated protein